MLIAELELAVAGKQFQQIESLIKEAEEAESASWKPESIQKLQTAKEARSRLRIGAEKTEDALNKLGGELSKFGTGNADSRGNSGGNSYWKYGGKYGGKYGSKSRAWWLLCIQRRHRARYTQGL